MRLRREEALKENIAKLRLDLVLLGVRAVTIVFWLYILWMSIEVRLSLQIISDDGYFS